MMSLWDALRMNMMISYQELVRTFLSSLVGDAHLGDPCPARRLASLASSLAHHAGLSNCEIIPRYC
ncbi:hypothetical protein C5P44_08620 [Escherichia coli]|nr:hypothetical protein C5P44_08620 [Escherichia coli]